MTEQKVRPAVPRHPGLALGAFRLRGSCRRRSVRYTLLAVAALSLAGAAWITVTGLLARSELLNAQRDLATLRQSIMGSPGSATPASPDKAMRSAAAHAARAHKLTTGPAWYAASHVPFLGRPLSTVRGIAQAADQVAGDILPPMVHLAAKPPDAARRDGLPALLSTLRGRAPALDRAAQAASDTRRLADGLPPTPWVPGVDRARTQLISQLHGMAPAMADVAVAGRVLPPMLGADGPRRYIVVFQNTAESRGTGGLPGAFTVLTAHQGRLRFETFGTDGMLVDERPDIDLGAEYRRRYGAMNPTGTWANSNVSPHFPYAARIWAAMWREHSGQRVDGAIALDPSAMGRLLQATGPARLPDGTAVTADNVVDLTERTAYASFSDSRVRQAYLLDVARAAAATLIGTLDTPERMPELLRATYDVAGEGRLQVWSAQPREQRLLQSRPVAGALPAKPGPFAGLVLINAAGGKLDYYLDRELHWIPGRCTRRGRPVIARITLANRAPTSGLPPYVTQRGDKPPYPTRPGDNRLLVSYYASSHARLTRATLDGRPVNVGSGTERGHAVFTVDVELPAQQSRTLKLHLLEPISDQTPVLLRQPLITPLRARVDSYPACRG
ncbi:DUF4012 domain-containing protein [Streptomyces cupreus]|uniref:DUF4012 domain-containing protein n=1 Tax=Streptomyces cupreus TaxID=2759956 RepID=A0A7X1JAT2_9ACTN|nr:DUF4012 domain-containing protein [Streptomyces cupreus]MBC2906875.1 DUF4012 domain-containing protein [Streptomyces cupreus]